MRYKHLKYDIRTGTAKIKTRLAIFTSLVAMGAGGVGLAVAMPFSASAHNSQGSGGNNHNTGPCNGSLVINVKQKIRNDADSGVGGNTWANDNYHRQIKVWKTDTNTFCAVTKYDGQFTTYEGVSPSGLSTVGAGVTGNFDGGYTTTTFTGALKASPSKPTHGNIGTFDYACTPAATEPGAPICPGYVDWTTFYFDSTSGYDLAVWSWQYDTCKNGSWVNASTGNTGDITGNVQHHNKNRCHKDKHHHDNGGHHDKHKHCGPRD